MRKRRLTKEEKIEKQLKKQEKKIIKVGKFNISNKKNTKPGEINKVRLITKEHSDYNIYFDENGEKRPEWYSNALLLGCKFKKELKKNVNAFKKEEDYVETDFNWYCLGKQFQDETDNGDWGLGDTRELALQNYMARLMEKNNKNTLEDEDIKNKIMEQINKENN